jgi:hypothetical protein
MKCKVVSRFIENEQETRDDYYIVSSNLRHHISNNILLMIQIVEVYDEPERMLGYQRTWVKK